MNAVIVGASAGLGRALVEECARRGHRVLLVARDERDLTALAQHVRTVHGVDAATCACELHEPEEAASRIGAAVAALGGVDLLLLPAGGALPHDDGLVDAAARRRTLDLNFTAVVAIVTELWPYLSRGGPSYLVGFGSIAAMRGRRSNVLYAAAKRALLSYFESLRHRAAGTSLRVHFYQPGYLATSQTFGKRLLLPAAQPADLARVVLDRLDRDQGPKFYPTYWKLVDVALRHLPWWIYRRLDF